MDQSYSKDNMTTTMQTLASRHTSDEIRQFVERRIGGLLRLAGAELTLAGDRRTPLTLRFGMEQLSDISREAVTRSLETVLNDMTVLSHVQIREPKSGIKLKSHGVNTETKSPIAETGAGLAPEVASALAHKLRNYLAAIISAGEQLQDTLADTATKEQLQLAELISRAAQEQRVLIDRFVYAFGPINVRSQRTNIGQLIRLNLERLEKTRGLRIENDSSEKQVYVNTDIEMLGRIVAELATNAVEVSPISNPSLLWQIKDGQLIISVNNAEPEVREPKDLSQSMPFVTDKPGHVGLGMSIVRRYVEALHGTLQSTYSKGRTTLIVMIPIQSENQTNLHTERNS